MGIEPDGVNIIKWIDKRPVLMITSDPSHTSSLLKNRKNNRNSEEILKPKCVIDYNKAKKGVDFSGQMSSYNTEYTKMSEVVLESCV